MISRQLNYQCFLAFILLALLSCQKEAAVNFPVRIYGMSLYARNAAGVNGTIDFAKPQKLDYRFSGSAAAAMPLSLEIEYCFKEIQKVTENDQIILTIGEDAWILPSDLSFLDTQAGEGCVFHYAIPVQAPLPPGFFIELSAGQKAAKQTKAQSPIFRLISLELKTRWYGFYREQSGAAASLAGANIADTSLAGANTTGEHFYLSPFVYQQSNAAEKVFVLDAPSRFDGAISAATNLDAAGWSFEAWAQPLRGGKAAVASGGLRFQAIPLEKTLNIPPGLIWPHANTALFSGADFFKMSYRPLPEYPQPIPADPGLVLNWPLESWRNRQYEVFSWDGFPSILIFDTASYEAQDKLFKRLAFFTEKAGFRGRLAPDAEIADLHGWNAHDYRAQDLARFFELARAQNFPLLQQERELQGILLDAGILRRDSSGAIHSGEGALVSISRESPNYLRSLFMAHEGFHGLFFIDEDFRVFCRNRWASLPRQAKVFIRSFFDFQRYDINDETLMVNEFMAHVLQQPVLGAAKYFGETLPRRLEATAWRLPALGEKDEAADSWPQLAEAFTQEAESFSAYVNQRWGLSAGRTWQLSVTKK